MPAIGPGLAAHSTPPQRGQSMLHRYLDRCRAWSPAETGGAGRATPSDGRGRGRGRRPRWSRRAWHPGNGGQQQASRPAGHSRPPAEATQDEKHGVQLLAAFVPSPPAPLLVLLHTSSRGGGRVMGGQYGLKQSCTRRADVVPGGVEEGRAQSPGRQLLETGP
ncbi:hypothetical protein BS50DRAFT_56148 [Corynespora cassiicola Philippines]|uniref:Uncharacterized protein n=1 Tax=Corynespora cassiicola Philippines TaxID=1448308 RepID=A0A2T2NIU8_CORCC|nr:hypothetical protein BS50DRAFT_56148 [Corynespora cassiicola Philippines]